MSDFYFVMNQVSKVYSHITNGMLSKPNYHASGVISCADEVLNAHVAAAVEEAIAEYELRFDPVDNDF